MDTKYKIEETDKKKFIVNQFLNYKIVDNKTVIFQVQKFQIILSDIHAKGMKFIELFQVVALIEKLLYRRTSRIKQSISVKK